MQRGCEKTEYLHEKDMRAAWQRRDLAVAGKEPKVMTNKTGQEFEITNKLQMTRNEGFTSYTLHVSN